MVDFLLWLILSFESSDLVLLLLLLLLLFSQTDPNPCKELMLALNNAAKKKKKKKNKVVKSIKLYAIPVSHFGNKLDPSETASGVYNNLVRRLSHVRSSLRGVVCACVGPLF